MKKTDLVIGIPREIHDRCRCVSMIPPMVRTLVQRGHPVLMERDAGLKAFYPSEMYEEAGARILPDAAAVYGEADVILKIRPPLANRSTGAHELDMMKKGAAILAFLTPLQNAEIVRKLVANRLTGFSMESIPRISRAQSMDALSSFGSISGYRAALLAAYHLGKFFPLLMTAAGTVQPANVLVIGAGVAGLQAIAICHMLGARVEAFDTRKAVREQVQSVGARFVEMELPEDIETRYGYAKEASPEFIQKEMETTGERLPRTDAVISTALVYGHKAPVLISEEMVKRMKPGSAIIDLAAEQGGNCALTQPGETIEAHGVIIHGAVELPSQMPVHTSFLYSRNVLNAFDNLYAGEEVSIDLEDEVNRNAVITLDGRIVSEAVQAFLASLPEKGGT
jgi:NAD(P) transhydrogenase subunit alpha